MMFVLAVYVVMALLAAIIGVAIQDTGVAGVASALLLLAIGAIAYLWKWDAA